MEKYIWLIRHGETDFNRQGIVQGSGVDTSLNEEGQRQARAFFDHYRSEPFDKILISNLQRTHQTVRHFWEAGLPVEQHAAINEISWGFQEGLLPTPESREEYEFVSSSWSAGNLHARVKGGESAHELGQRLKPFIEELKTRSEKNLLVCTHGRTLRGILALMLEDDLSAMERYHHHNTCLYLVRYEPDRFVAERFNDLTHLGIAHT